MAAVFYCYLHRFWPSKVSAVSNRMHPPMGQLQQNGRNRVVLFVSVRAAFRAVNFENQSAERRKPQPLTNNPHVNPPDRSVDFPHRLHFFPEQSHFCWNKITDATSQ
jgi:hypothetical protein